MSQYSPIIIQQTIESEGLKKLSESDISDLEKCARKMYPLMIPLIKASLVWPFWSGIKKYGSWVLFLFLVVFIISTFSYGARILSDDEFDMNIVMELCIQNCCLFYIILAMYFLTLNKKIHKTFQELLFLMVRNLFQCSTEEKEFLQNYVHISNVASYVISGVVFVSNIMYVIVIPLILPAVANLILPGNHTYQRKFSAHSEFLIDEDTYFYSNFFILSILSYTIIVFLSSLSICYVSAISYITGKFRFMGFKLKQISTLSQTEDFLEKDEEMFKRVSQLVQLHQYCIYFFDLLNTITNSILVIGMLSVIIGCSVSGCVMVLEFKRDMNIVLKMSFVYIVCVECLFLVSFPSQKIYNASSDIFDICYLTDWYRYSIKTKKRIQLIMMKSLRLSGIKIGPSTFMNYETSRQIIQLSLSYITALISIYNR